MSRLIKYRLAPREWFGPAGFVLTALRRWNDCDRLGKRHRKRYSGVVLRGFRGFGVVGDGLAVRCLPVPYRNAVIVGMDLAEGEESVPIPAEIDEGRLDAWLRMTLIFRDPRETTARFDCEVRGATGGGSLLRWIL